MKKLYILLEQVQNHRKRLLFKSNDAKTFSVDELARILVTYEFMFLEILKEIERLKK